MPRLGWCDEIFVCGAVFWSKTAFHALHDMLQGHFEVLFGGEVQNLIGPITKGVMGSNMFIGTIKLWCGAFGTIHTIIYTVQ